MQHVLVRRWCRVEHPARLQPAVEQTHQTANPIYQYLFLFKKKINVALNNNEFFSHHQETGGKWEKETILKRNKKTKCPIV